MRNALTPRRGPESMIEMLEGRRMLSATVEDDGLEITGTDSDDRIVVRQTAAGNIRVALNGESVRFFHPDRFNVIKVFGGDGIDRITVENSVTMKTKLAGGDGNDIISGGAGNDYIFCGAGDDRADGNGGSDTISAGAGDDTLFGGAGNDTIDGSGGDDVINGEDGIDRIIGGSGGDTIDGGAGLDVISGSRGFDLFQQQERDNNEIRDFGLVAE